MLRTRWLTRSAAVAAVSIAIIGGAQGVAQAHPYERNSYGYPAGSGLCQLAGQAGMGSMWDGYFCTAGTMYPDSEDLWVHYRHFGT